MESSSKSDFSLFNENNSLEALKTLVGENKANCNEKMESDSTSQNTSLFSERENDSFENQDLNTSDLVLVGEFKKNDDINSLNTSDKKVLEVSGNSDVQILEDTPDKEKLKLYNSETKSLSDSIEIVGEISLNNMNDSDIKNSKIIDIFKKDHMNKMLSLQTDSTGNIDFDVKATYSTPNIQSLSDSTESLLTNQVIQKKITLCVEIIAAVHQNKELWTGEIMNVTCNNFNDLNARRLSDSSGNLGDISKSISPSSSTVSGSLTQFPLKSHTQNRFSMISTSSSSSIVSSANTLARMIRDGKLFSKKENVKLTLERVDELREKWLNSNDIFKILDFVDKIILHADSVTNEDSFKNEQKPKDVEEKESLSKIEEITTPVSMNKTRPGRGKRQAKVKFSSDSENEIPKKRAFRVETPKTPPPLIVSTNFSKGDSVFAKWSDRKFYAAILGDMTPDGKWVVNFFDGDTKSLLEEFLIKAEEYTMIGHSVYASQGDDNFTPGIITCCLMKDNTLHYTVARDKGDICVPCQFIYITETQARQIRGKSSSNLGLRTPTKQEQISSPYTPTKRSTRSKTRLLLDSPKPSSSGTQKNVQSDSDDESINFGEMNVEDVTGVEPESHGMYENGIKLKGKTISGKMRFSRTKTSDTDATVLGPIPVEGSNFFKNLHVLLTCTRPQSPKFHYKEGNNSETGTSTDSENYNFSKIPFIKDRLKLQLQTGGATVYNNFDDICQKLWKQTYLISNRPNISAKYIQCLAVGIKCTSHEWVIRCCKENKRLPVQELPLGWSLERERFFNSFDKKSSASLRKLNVLIVDTADKNFYKFWSKVCKLAEINVNKLTRDSNLEPVNVIISESGYKDEHVERVISHNIPLVTTSWLIQSLLHGEPRKYDGHKSYLTDYIDSD